MKQKKRMHEGLATAPPASFSAFFSFKNEFFVVFSFFFSLLKDCLRRHDELAITRPRSTRKARSRKAVNEYFYYPDGFSMVQLASPAMLGDRSHPILKRLAQLFTSQAAGGRADRG